MVTYLSGIQYMVILFLLMALAIKVSSNAERIYEREDPPEVVIDEVVGFLVTMAFIAPTITNIVLGFLLFRALDILKPFPCRRLEKLHGGYGIVMDDVAAGVWANVLLVAIINILFK
jgi:phosphatidylglycerophosphatase A